VVGNYCHFDLEADLLWCLIIALKSWTACYRQIDQFPHAVGPRGGRPCMMEWEVARQLHIPGAPDLSLHARSAKRSGSPGVSPA